MCAVADPATPLMGHLVSGIAKGVSFLVKFYSHLSTETWIQRTDPFLSPPSINVNLTSFCVAWLLHWIPTACSFLPHLWTGNLFCSGTAFIAFVLEPSTFLACKTIINIFCSFWYFHSTHKSTIWQPPAAKMPWEKQNRLQERTCHTKEGWMDTNLFQWFINTA